MNSADNPRLDLYDPPGQKQTFESTRSARPRPNVMLVRLLPPPLLLLALLPPSQHVAAAAVAGGSRCGTALSVACAEARADVFRCAQCAGSHAGALQAAGCSNDSIALWCAGQQPLDTPLTLRLATDAATATAFPPGRRYTPAGFWAASTYILQQLRPPPEHPLALW